MDNQETVVDHSIIPAQTPTTPSPQQQRCKHEQFKANVHVNRQVEQMWPHLTRFVAQVQVICADCGMPFLFPFMGQPTDNSNGISPDGRVALLHIVPAKKDFP